MPGLQHGAGSATHEAGVRGRVHVTPSTGLDVLFDSAQATPNAGRHNLAPSMFLLFSGAIAPALATRIRQESISGVLIAEASRSLHLPPTSPLIMKSLGAPSRNFFSHLEGPSGHQRLRYWNTLVMRGSARRCSQGTADRTHQSQGDEHEGTAPALLDEIHAEADADRLRRRRDRRQPDGNLGRKACHAICRSQPASQPTSRRVPWTDHEGGKMEGGT